MRAEIDRWTGKEGIPFREADDRRTLEEVRWKSRNRSTGGPPAKIPRDMDGTKGGLERSEYRDNAIIEDDGWYG